MTRRNFLGTVFVAAASVVCIKDINTETKKPWTQEYKLPLSTRDDTVDALKYSHIMDARDRVTATEVRDMSALMGERLGASCDKLSREVLEAFSKRIIA